MSEVREFFTPKEAAEFLRYSPATLAVWRSQGEGPAYMKIGHSVRYTRVDLTKWATGGEAARRHIKRDAECHRSQRTKVKRARGRVGAEQRHRRLAAEPYCRDCAKVGIKRRAEEVDHIVPLAFGGTDTDDNVRSLCQGCHANRTRAAASLKRQMAAERV
ncbi:helix-turn-helix domain-containing protein [Novosphingobium sp.]|uniref:helix-turn-helix domain-containing protein n=1 Tax=Novosphingobium sp. TaxID=1874826 RepID=UPI0038F6AEBB